MTSSGAFLAGGLAQAREDDHGGQGCVRDRGADDPATAQDDKGRRLDCD